jgi:hypothetical protein
MKFFKRDNQDDKTKINKKILSIQLVYASGSLIYIQFKPLLGETLKRKVVLTIFYFQLKYIYFTHFR